MSQKEIISDGYPSVMKHHDFPFNIPTIPVFVVTGAGSIPCIVEDVLEAVFERIDGTGESVGFNSIRMRDG